MLKSVLYVWLLLTTAVRLGDMIYLLLQDTLNLPIPVVVVTIAMMLYACVLLARRFVSSVRLRPLMMFFIVQTVVVLFNIAYIAFNSPLQPTWQEILVIGSFLEVLLNAGIVYLCIKRMRSRNFVTVGHVQ